MNQMGHEPETSLEQESVCPDTDIFLLTHDNIKALKLLLSQVVCSFQGIIVLMLEYTSLVLLLLQDKVYLEHTVSFLTCLAGNEEGISDFIPGQTKGSC